jgi:hypothetical protein
VKARHNLPAPAGPDQQITGKPRDLAQGASTGRAGQRRKERIMHTHPDTWFHGAPPLHLTAIGPAVLALAAVLAALLALTVALAVRSSRTPG